MRRRPLLLAAVLAAALVAALLPARAALAGGVCRGERVTDAKGTTVTMRDLCYRPTVLRVQPGAQVTFVNKDVEAHPTVGHGGAWGIDGVTGGRPAAVRFDEPGIYPYFCHQHLGMVGVVVVGDGRAAAGLAAPVDVADPPAPQPAGAGTAAEPAAARATSWPLPGVVLLGLAAAAGAAVVVARRRRGAPRPSL